MMSRLIAGTFIAAVGIGLGYPAIAAADPVCPINEVRVQGEIVTTPAGDACDSEPVESGGGLLGNAPVVGNLPGLGGVL
jgi:hypothetical protein